MACKYCKDIKEAIEANNVDAFCMNTFLGTPIFKDNDGIPVISLRTSLYLAVNPIRAQVNSEVYPSDELSESYTDEYIDIKYCPFCGEKLFKED